MVTCVICGKENPAGVEYCEDCGAALATTSAPAAVAAAPEGTQGAVAAPDMPAPADSLSDIADPLLGTAPTTPATSEAVPTLPVAAPTAPMESAAPAATSNPRLAVKRYGAVTAEEIPLHGDHLVVGRFDPETGPVDIDLSAAPEAGQLSRHHAELYREADGGWYVKDLGSTNGVFVKRPDSSTFGPRLTTPTALTPGDEVAFGNARFLFKAD